MPSSLTNDTDSKRRTNKPRLKPPLWRLRVWQLLLALSFLIILGRLYYLQIIIGPDLKNRAFVQRQQNNLLVHRGSITDRHGLPLAIDTTRYDLYIHPALLPLSVSKAAGKIASIIKQPQEDVLKNLSSGFSVTTVARGLNREQADELQKLNWTGVDIFPRSFRHYPEGKLAAHVLGYVNLDTKGQGGIEQSKESTLKDTGTTSKPQLDGHGHMILTAEGNSNVSPPSGRQVELTIDNYLQHLAEKELSAMFIHSRSQKATAIILDPTNGEILAWANAPAYDPNNYSKYPLEVTKNWSMVDVYQPGSTFKIITVASALDCGAIKPNSTFQDSGSIKVGNRVIHNHEPGALGTVDLLHLFIHSSNVASAQVGMSMPPKVFYDKLYDFSIGRTTGIDLPGESQGLLLNHKNWTPIDQATTGFGQGAIAITPLQLASAVGAVANGGVWVQPHLIRRVYDPQTGVTERWTTPNRRQVISRETAQLVSRLLAENISLGSQIAGKIPGYRTAGKTGTAQKVIEGSKGYVAGQTIASFIGFLPADNPQLLCLVIFDSPQTDGRWGNTIAGPVFNAICMEAARYLGIPPSVKIDSKGLKAFIPPSQLYANEIKDAESAAPAKD